VGSNESMITQPSHDSSLGACLSENDVGDENLKNDISHIPYTTGTLRALPAMLPLLFVSTQSYILCFKTQTMQFPAATPLRANLSPCVDLDLDLDIEEHSNFVAELSFEAGHERLFTMNPETTSTPNHHLRRQQGVLWKRRDVFKNRWRPRWFVLHPGQGVLTYYLLSNTSNNLTTSQDAAATSTPQNANRRRTFSESSTVSQNPMDYDVVPRGTIYLLGCTVEINRELTRASDELFSFTITSNTTRSTNDTEENIISSLNPIKCHLAARTAASRARWMRTIQQVCDNNNNNNNVIPQPLSSSSQTTPTRTNRSLVFEQEQQPDPPSLQEENADATTATTTAPPATTRTGVTHFTPAPTWTTIPSPLLFQNVPSPLEQHMEDVIAKYLPLLDPVKQKGWTPLFDRDGVVASTRIIMDTNNKRQQQLLQSSSIVPHLPSQILNLLLDTSQRKDWEHNVRHDEQLLQYNPHTRLDYSAYHPVWPTSARDFAVCVQWRLVTLTNATATTAASAARENGDSAQKQQPPPSLLLVTCSVPQADLLKPPQPNHVRAHLEVSLQLLQPIGIDNKSCRHTRILSYDLCGNIPKHLTNHIMMQQANLPRVVDLHLRRTIKPIVPTHLIVNMDMAGPLTNDYIIQNIIPTTTGKRSLQVEDHQDSIVVSDEEPSLLQSVNKDMALPSLAWIATVLMGPIIVYNKLKNIFGMEWIFIISAWYAIRWVVLAQIGKPLLPPNGASGSSNPSMVVTCRFTVDLKGVLRFISNKQEERQERKDMGADAHAPAESEISVTHIVMSALAQSLVKYPSFNRTHISYPLLLVDGYVSNNDSVHMGIPNPSGGLLSIQIVKHKTVQEIANALAQAEHVLTETQKKEPSSLLSQLFSSMSLWQPLTPLPQFVVMATPDSDHCQVDIDAGNLPGVTVAVVVSGIRLVQKKPTLSMSLTIQSPLAVETCREFAEHVQKLVQFPEMCDE
jgi:hypothetical protein